MKNINVVELSVNKIAELEIKKGRYLTSYEIKNIIKGFQKLICK